MNYEHPHAISVTCMTDWRKNWISIVNGICNVNDKTIINFSTVNMIDAHRNPRAQPRS